ncbi:exopolysaccharide biosynthesis protein [Paenibacillus pectinilyticus]|uniref:Exopolysaccharide biosynthesis protein n=1 Tax=Paenibacillus pectinilyticus TaxID=512399 RepID=A0A1C1A225_9BACL|nr:phosphodiester glycosidase family protein [Paenibacillus pectinilyticus]OCT14576.1 exopolysaccharide biosynthesis protein [Paenibacillus pectinilyticus]
MTMIAIFLMIIAAILYGLADRYLFEHVAVIVTPNSVATQEQPAKQATTQAQSDDWNYKDSNETVSIKKVQTGSGSDAITYFVADVTFNNTTNLLTAFAKNAFGTNIIENTSTIAANNNAVFAINGDYYGFRNDGVIIRGGTVYRDEPARDGLALLANGTLQSYNEKELSSADLLAEGTTNTFSFGPTLVTGGEVAGDFSSVAIDKNFGNRSIQDANPRTGIGMISPNHFLFVVVDGRSTNYSRGMTLTEFANLFHELGATEAYNLDGGGSSTMYFMGRVVNNPLGKGSERGVSDIIYVPKS